MMKRFHGTEIILAAAGILYKVGNYLKPPLRSIICSLSVEIVALTARYLDGRNSSS